MPRISGTSGIQPQEGGERPQLAASVQDHIRLMSEQDALSYVVGALKPLVATARSSQHHQAKPLIPAQSLHAERLDALNQELKVLKQIADLIRAKPSDYESQMQQFLHAGESIADLEKTVPQEIIEIEEKIRAVATANVLIDEIK